MVLSILIVVAMLSLLVLIHELGHFLAARWSGVEVKEFGFGFPPRLVGWLWGKTVVSINSLPLGGFVRMKGEDLDDQSPGGFGAASFGRKTFILLAGVGMNALAGYLILLCLTMTGLPPLPSLNFSQTGATYAQAPRVLVTEVAGGSAADRAGIKKGDVIVSGNGQSFSDPDQLRVFTKSEANQTVSLQLLRHGHPVTQTVKLDKGTADGGQLGVVPFKTYQLRFRPTRAVVVSGQIFWQMLTGTFWGIVHFFGDVPSLSFGVFQKATPQTTAVGPIGIAVIISNLLFLGWRTLALVTVSITLSLAVINLFPVPILDGGRWLMIALARLRKQNLSPRSEKWLFITSMIIVGLVFVLVIALDSRRFL